MSRKTRELPYSKKPPRPAIQVNNASCVVGCGTRKLFGVIGESKSGIWAYRALRGPGVRHLPTPGPPLASDTHVVSYPNRTKHRGFYWKHKQIGISAYLSRTRNILVEVFRDMFFRFYGCISSAYLDKTYFTKLGEIGY